MKIGKLLLIITMGYSVTACMGVGIGVNVGLNGLNGPGGQLRPSPQNHAVIMSIRCPTGTTPVQDTGIVAGFLDERVNRNTNWRPNRNWGRGRGGNRNNSPYGLGSVQRDSQQEFARTLTCNSPQGLIERTLGVEVRRNTDSFRGGNWNERPFDSGWQQVRQQDYRR